MKKRILCMVVLSTLLIMFLSGCTVQYKLLNVHAEKTHIAYGEETRINFDIQNPSETTLSSKVETIITNPETGEENPRCFFDVEIKEVSAVSPKSKTSAYIRVVTSSSSNYREDCEGESFLFSLLLEDVTGNILDEELTTISITE